MKRVCAMLLLLLSLHPAAVLAGAAEDALQRFADKVQTLSARFTQTQYDEHGEVLSTRQGAFELARPGRFRWSYDAPYEQLMVCDGGRIWNYEPDLAQVSVRDASVVLKGTPAALLAQKSLIGEAYRIESGGQSDGVDVVRLLPRGDADFSRIELHLRRGVPQRMRFFDAIGGHTDIRFADIRTGIRLDPARFRFTPPKHVEVIDDDGLAGP